MPRAKRAAKQKPSLCNRCGDRHLPPTGKKCTRPRLEDTVREVPDDVSIQDTSESEEGHSERQGACGGARPRDTVHATGHGNMHYDSVLSRLVTSVDAIQARVFGSEQFSGPYPPIDRPTVQAASNHDLQRPLS
jgi:hypothetical protein